MIAHCYRRDDCCRITGALRPACDRAEGHELPRLPFTPDDECKRQ
jgi:hypothetical protein